MAKTSRKLELRRRRRRRIRKRLQGTSERPRLAIYRSARHIYAQVIDDGEGRTLAAASSLKGELPEAPEDAKLSAGRARAWGVGALLAQTAKEAGITKVVFDRGGFLYHGRVAALADGARAGGLDL